MEQNSICKNLLIILLGFLSIGAFCGGISLIIRPDGSFFQMPGFFGLHWRRTGNLDKCSDVDNK